MKTKKYYFYEDTKEIKDRQAYFTIYEVNSFNNNVDEAERKARTAAHKRNKELAGGLFVEDAKPYNFQTNYTVIKVNNNTKIEPYNAKDKFIIGLIEAESNIDYTIL